MKIPSSAAAVALFSSLALAAPAVEQQQAATPSVVGTAPKATYVGSTSQNVESFKGIPFAQSVAGKNRLAPPKAINTSLGTVQATQNGKSCPQMSIIPPTDDLPSEVITMLMNTPFGQQVQNQGEDCLTLNVQRPAGTNESSNLPVAYWIYGGGFEFGSTSTYDGSSLISTSVSQKQPFVYVAVNYRVSGFGFLGGKEIKEAGASNLGLLDQRLGLQWVADNIKKFGGDPSKVTIFGESAGAISVLDQMVLYNGNNNYKGKPLFRGAIMNSGSIVPANPVDGTKAQTVYNAVVAASGCSGKANTLQCLRNAPYETFLNATNSVPGIFAYQSLDLSYLPRPDGTVLTESPELLVQAGKYTKVPFIIGDLEDEGTLFSLVQTNVTTGPEIIDYLHNLYFPDAPRSRVAGLVHTYPDNPAAGSPFGSSPLNEIRPEFKRLAAILGDITFTITRRLFLTIVQEITPNLPTYSYLASFEKGTPILGTFHGSDIPQVYGEIPGSPSSTFQSYYIAFFTTLNPNTGSATSLPTWPLWTKAKNLVGIAELTNTIVPDNFRMASFNFLATPGNTLRI